jgi:predicted GNAT family acetyltransferase
VPEVLIRRVRPADAGRARALRLEMLADTPLAYITTLAEAAERPHADYAGFVLRCAHGTQNAMFVADYDGVLVGQAFGATHPTEEDTTMVYAVYVTPDQRGRGLLGRLVDALGAWSAENGRPKLELEVVTSNLRALRAYQKLGFACSGEPVPHPTVPILREQVLVRRAATDPADVQN